MAIVWSKNIEGKHYEVRSAGKTRRLYTNKVCHSQYHPESNITGSVWDLLSIPVFFYNKQEIKRVLVLGVGGGAVLRQINNWFSPNEIVGVELDAIHLSIAKRFFNLKQKNIQLFEANAKDWLLDYKGDTFDIIIEDMFTEVNGEPIRPIIASAKWINSLLERLHDDGMLILNFGSLEEFNASVAMLNKTLNKKFKSIFKLTTPGLDNHVAVYSRTEFKTKQLRERLLSTPELASALHSKKLKYRIRQEK